MSHSDKPISQTNEIVNVSKVRHLSPFRFPGGKTWLVPRVKIWLKNQLNQRATFIEPFAGGAIVGLTVARENFAERVIFVEIDEAIAAVWRVIINGEGNAHWLVDQIMAFEMDEQHLDRELNRQPETIEERAFQTILRNRISRSGILAPGAGRIKRGENNKGIRSRWYPKTLASRILQILDFREHMQFIHGDGLEVIEENVESQDTFFFIDPPYSASAKGAGFRLYTYSEINHELLFDLAKSARGDFLMTYNNDPFVRQLAQRHGFDIREVIMRTAHHTTRTELLIGRDLDWIRY